MVWEVSYRLVLNQCSSISYYSCLLLASQPFNQNQLRQSNQILLWLIVTQENLTNFKPSQLVQQRVSETSAPPLGLWDFGERGYWTSIQQWIKQKHWELLMHRPSWFCGGFFLLWDRIFWNKISPNFTRVLYVEWHLVSHWTAPFTLIHWFYLDMWLITGQLCVQLQQILSVAFFSA